MTRQGTHETRPQAGFYIRLAITRRVGGRPWRASNAMCPMSMAIGFSPAVATKFPTGGHQISPLVAIISPHWWPSNVPTWGESRGSGQGLDPLSGGCLREPVAVLALGDDHVCVMQEPVDGCGRHCLGHQLVVAGGVDVR
jgi:hypothetical protein